MEDFKSIVQSLKKYAKTNIEPKEEVDEESDEFRNTIQDCERYLELKVDQLMGEIKDREILIDKLETLLSLL